MKPTETSLCKAMDALVETNKRLMETVDGLLKKMQETEAVRAQQQQEKMQQVSNLVAVGMHFLQEIYVHSDLCKTPEKTSPDVTADPGNKESK